MRKKLLFIGPFKYVETKMHSDRYTVKIAATDHLAKRTKFCVKHTCAHLAR